MSAGTDPHGEHEEGAYENLPHFDGNEASSAAFFRYFRHSSQMQNTLPFGKEPNERRCESTKRYTGNNIASIELSVTLKALDFETTFGWHADASMLDLAYHSMAQNEQNSSNSSKWRDVATTIATSTSSGTAANTVALVVVLWYLLPRMFPPLRPSEAINLLEDAIKEVADMYDEHKSILGDWATFETRFNRLELAALELKEKHIQDSLNVSWASLPSRLSHEKYAWATARVHRREVDSLKSWLVVSTSSPSSGEAMLTARVPKVGDNQGEEGSSSNGS
ncbi:hypothetical protein ARMSODRAFT_975555 [Armillaria solidipes]|uniref:Uncharacterized protein n=1 Tax=Armillaria solidipes TaxID=1076256 RepID=A0A2H3BCR2_9AGAR|nr:hypothetical protein ARMSODRAFT_975555 [Armillaria solidipes]